MDLPKSFNVIQKIALQARKILLADGNSGETANIAQMIKLASAMMQDAITALIEEDVELAREIIKRDKEVNRLNKKNFKFFSASTENDRTENATCFQKIFISKAIERIADHAKNLADEVIYLLSGAQNQN